MNSIEFTICTLCGKHGCFTDNATYKSWAFATQNQALAILDLALLCGDIPNNIEQELRQHITESSLPPDEIALALSLDVEGARIITYVLLWNVYRERYPLDRLSNEECVIPFSRYYETRAGLLPSSNWLVMSANAINN